MKQRLTEIGSDFGFIIEKSLAERYQLDWNTEIEVTPEEDCIVIRIPKAAFSYASTENVMQTAADIMERYNDLFKELAKL